MADLLLHLDGGSAAAQRVRLSFGGETGGEGRVDLRLDRADLDDLRWLWADPTSDRYADTSGRRRRAEMAVVRIGAVLGRAFTAPPGAEAMVQQALAQGAPSVRIHAADPRIMDLPWELATTPQGRFWVGRAKRFVRLAGSGPARPPRRQRTGAPRVLLVVSRPSGDRDVPYTAVAGTLLESLEGRAEVRVVRPGTLAALAGALREDAWDYVHFDGHGVPGGLRFEDGFVRVDALARALGRQDGRIFTLNACDSAVGGRGNARGGSVARTLLDAGAAGVVGMGAAVRVSSAATFFAGFYARAAKGSTLADAAAAGRKALQTDDLAGVADWGIPVVYVRNGDDGPGPRRARRREPRAADAPPAAEPFVGRDGELWTLDRRLDTAGAVLIHGAIGIGKTELARHLLEWRRRTGGADRVISFSFHSHPSLDALSRALQAEALATGTAVRETAARSAPLSRRLARAASALAEDGTSRIVLLDQVDVVSGLPDARRNEARLRRLVAALGRGSCRVVLTARSGCAGWLGAGVQRFPLAGVRPADRLRLLRAHAQRLGSWSRIEPALRAAGGRAAEEGLTDVLGGHPLAARMAAHRLRSRTLRHVTEALVAGGALPVPRTAEGPGRPHALADSAQRALDGVDPEHRRVAALLGLFGGELAEGDFIRFVAGAGLPARTFGRRPDGARALRCAAEAGLISPAAPGEGWRVVPGVAPVLLQALHAGLAPAEAAGVEAAFVRFWDAEARAHHARLQADAPDQATAFVRRSEGSLLRALEVAGTHAAWGPAYGILRLWLNASPFLGRWSRSRRLLVQWLARTEAAREGEAEDGPLSDLWRMVAGERAEQLAREGRFGQAMALYARIEATLRADEVLFARDLAVYAFQVGTVQEQRGALGDAEARFREALGRWEALGDERGQSHACLSLGDLDETRGRLAEAWAWYARALELDRRTDDRYGTAILHARLGRIELRRGELGAAEAWCRAGLELLAAMPLHAVVASLYSDLGMIATERGRLDDAEGLLLQALQIHESLGNEANVAALCHQLGQMEHERGDRSPYMGPAADSYAAAEAWYRRSAQIEEARGDRLGAASSFHQLGVLEQDRENPAAAEAWYRKALAWSRGSRDPEHLGIVHGQLGRCLAELGRPQAAAEHLIAGYDALRRARAPQAATLEKDLAAVREVLGREGFARAWRRAGAGPRTLQAFTAGEADLSPECPAPDPHSS